MPRHRLHGETQKRRRKQQTRALKRARSVARVTATQVPAGFERSPALEGDDVVFLEAMRELEVRRNPRNGEAPQRRQAIARQFFEDDQTQRGTFSEAMERLGAQPLQEAREGARHRPAPATPHSDPARAAPTPPTAAVTPQLPHPAGEAPVAPHPGEEAVGKPGGGEAAERAVGIEFAETSEDARLLAAALEGADFDPASKYEGATPPKPPPAPARRTENERPDAELDLHGKTQVEAIRAVQNFLLTAHRLRLREVLIITGRGLNSGTAGPVLNLAVFNWLERNGRRFAAEFRRAPSRLGGSGAIWVRLRAPRSPAGGAS